MKYKTTSQFSQTAAEFLFTQFSKKEKKRSRISVEENHFIASSISGSFLQVFGFLSDNCEINNLKLFKHQKIVHDVAYQFGHIRRHFRVSDHSDRNNAV